MCTILPWRRTLVCFMFYDCPVDISYQKLIKGTEEKLNNFIIEILEKKKKKQKKNDERPWMPAP